MKNIITLAFVLFVAYQCRCQLNSQADDLAQLKALNARFIHNFVTNDTVSHSKIIHHSFVCIRPDGRVVNRTVYLLNWLHGFDGYLYWDYRNESISIFGNTALVRSQNKYAVAKDGKESTGMSMYTDTYIKENGEWKCIQAQLLDVSPENYADDDTIVKKYDYRKK